MRLSNTMLTYAFRLYVVGQTLRAEMAESNLRFLCESHLDGRYDLEVIDATEHPERAEADGVIATPTVIRVAPLPQVRVIGDLSDHSRSAGALGLFSPGGPSDHGNAP